MTKWEYRTLRVETEGLLDWPGGKVDDQKVNALLNELGSDGWELTVGFDTNLRQGATRYVFLILKRPVV